jgi:hypothetical protein
MKTTGGMLYDFNKVLKVIKSCETIYHFIASKKMVQLFKDKYNWPRHKDYHNELDHQLIIKRKSIKF